MTASAEALKEAQIGEVVERLKTRVAGEAGEEVERFVRHYYAPASPDDLLAMEPGDLLGAALALWSFARVREPGRAKVRVYNPRVEDHGWQSRHTVIEVVNDDMPFLVDSVSGAIHGRGLDIHMLLHPVVRLRRDAAGELEDLCLADDEAPGSTAESLMHLEVDREGRPAALEELRVEIENVLEDVRLAVEDWLPIRDKVSAIADELEASPPPVDAEELAEVTAFLRWLVDDHFTFLGYREADLVRQKGREYLRAVPDSSLGVLRRARPSAAERPITLLSDEMSRFARRQEPLIVTKADSRATVHRPVHMDYIGIKRYNAAGEVVGERRILGLLTSVAYSRSPRTIPLLRKKVEHLVTRAGFPPKGHDAKSLVHILETFPRDELFQTSEEELLYIALGILQLQERQRIALFLREDPFERFVSCLVFVPRDRYNTELRLRFGRILEQALDGQETAVYSQIADSMLARVHFIIKTEPGRLPEYDRRQIEGRLTAAARTWPDRLKGVLVERFAEEKGLELHRRYGEAFPTAYRESFPPEAVPPDIENLERVRESGDLGLNLYRSVEGRDHQVRFKIYHVGHSLSLSDVLPKLENMGFRVVSEIPYAVHPAKTEEPVWIGDFELETADGGAVDLAAVKGHLHQTFLDVWHGRVENDGFNRLVLSAGLEVGQVAILRAYAKYLRQAGMAFSQRYIEATLNSNPRLARLLVELFIERFDPDRGEEADEREALTEDSIREALDEVANLDQDRIVRAFRNLIESTLRTNYFQPAENGEPKPYLSFKLDSQKVAELPAPRPRVEIFVYSPRFEAIHLRGGLVARGGLRWSDRREDFRTEILGLMKAQMVKNAVIVPVGAKGGFVLKQAPEEGGREALQREGITCYQMMIHGLLDLTDNLVEGAVVPPPSVVRHDGDDPYLVVAADKGTATFSDLANKVSKEYGFWLGDAFASGGSAGYDHKKIGITARGAWEAVKRHFRELGVDVQRQEITVAGVGDMSGDVFGNGMLQSPHLLLLGAFNHLHVFVDPNPDAARSFAERQRLFELPGSTWKDYSQQALSPGGAVFDRQAKSLELTPEIRHRFAIEEESLTPAELIRVLLKAPVDLLWFGGIGTYVKASDESNAEIGDRANDAVRVDGDALRCRVIGEGANLGLTQRGRIEFALNGGRNNTDAIDNSAGVDCSDHEVNIKILLDGVVASGDMTGKQRDLLLQEMTDEVAELVLRDNYLQNLAISVEESRGTALVDFQLRMMRELERAGKLDRALENLPDDETLAERAADDKGLTRPEIAILLAYAKLTLYQELLESDLPDDPLLVEDLVRYFPRPLRERYRPAIAGHRLRREIIATHTTNSMINRVGPTFVTRLGEVTGRSAIDIARAYTITRDVFRLRDLWLRIEELDDRLAAAAQMEMILDTGQLVERATLWFLRHSDGAAMDITATVRRFEPGVAALAEELPAILPKEHRRSFEDRAKELQRTGAPVELGHRIASLPLLASACDIVRIAGEREVREVARVYFLIGARLGIDWLRDAARRLRAKSRWQKEALEAIVEDLYAHQSVLTTRILEAGAGQAKPVEKWIEGHRHAVNRLRALLEDLRAAASVDIAMLTVADHQLRGLTLD